MYLGEGHNRKGKPNGRENVAWTVPQTNR